MYIYLNGKVVPDGEATLSVFDRGFLYGDGVFETLRVYKGSLFMPSRHMVRLRASADALDISLIADDELLSAIEDVLKANGLKDAITRVTLSRGTGGGGFDPTGDFTPTLVITARPFVPYPQ